MLLVYRQVPELAGRLVKVEFESRLKAYADRVDARLDELLPPAAKRPADLHSAMRYSCLAPGKRLRPALCLACCEAVGGRLEVALDAACAIEIVHCFSLIHDDLPALDNDDLRRGLPTCHVKFGEAIAILAGDALLALAFKTIADLGRSAARNEGRVLAALRQLTQASGSDGLAGGEALDVQTEGQDYDGETLGFIHTRKTGALMAASCAIGATLGGASKEEVDGLFAYGGYVGLAFQMADDLLNETATAAQIGKSVGSDRLRRKATYPGLFGVDEARHQARQAAESAIKALPIPSPTLEDFARFAIDRVK